MASNSKPTILALPLEIRHKIYRYAWTLQVDTNKYVGQRFPSWLNKSYVKLQVGQVQKLVSICRQMRDEVLSEYFHRTQVYFRWHRGQLAHHTSIHNNRPRPEFDAPHCIQFSHLLTHYTQHVSLQWEPCLCLGNSEGTRSASCALNWLLKLERLKTLELVISKRWVTMMEQLQAKASHRDLNATDLFICSSCFSKLMKLRNLEKVVFKVLSNWFDGDLTVAEKDEVERSKWFATTKKEIMDVILKAPNQEEPRRTYLIEQHIGGVDAEWPRSFSTCI